MKMKAIITIIVLLCMNPAAWAQKSLFVVHTSDTHSCIEPIAANYGDTAQADKGGYVRRATLIKQMRAMHPSDMLLLDCGDFSQGSVYYNLFRGDVEISLMNAMQYDACTLGNHEFDYGLENLARLIRMAHFTFVCCNYDFSATPCRDLVKPYVVIERAGVRVGIFGVSPQPQGLVASQNFEGMKYIKPSVAAQPIVNRLRGEEGCDVVICLSHLGWGIGGEDDQTLVARTSGIDILLGGHSHTYHEHPQILIDKDGHEVVAEHMGKNARFVGTMQVDVE